MTYIDNSPEDTRTPEDIVAAGGSVSWHYAEDRCPDCDYDRNVAEGWCRCIDEQMDEAAARDARFCFGPDPFPPTKESQ